jgi:hypothetical protein
VVPSAHSVHGVRQTRPFELKAEIRPGTWFIVGGQNAYVAEMGEVFTNAQGRTDARLRVIFDNGTESNMLMRSLQRALNNDAAGRRITDPVAGPLFSDQFAEDDQAAGTIYVLRSMSDDPYIASHRDLIHKIGVTNMPVAQIDRPQQPVRPRAQGHPARRKCRCRWWNCGQRLRDGKPSDRAKRGDRRPECAASRRPICAPSGSDFKSWMPATSAGATHGDFRPQPLDVDARRQRVLLDEHAARLDLVAHQFVEDSVGFVGPCTR